MFWKEAKVLQIEPKGTYRKFKGAAHIVLQRRKGNEENRNKRIKEGKLNRASERSKEERQKELRRRG
jgi:hypothetical protein